MAVHSYKDLVVWQKAMDLVEAVYRLSRSFPRDEMFGLTSQMRRSAVSVAANIAEGQGRGEGAEFAHFLRIANGSRQELETHLMIAIRLGYLAEAEASPAMELICETGRVLRGLQRAIEPM